MSEFRRDKATGGWRIIAPGRFSRPGEVKEGQKVPVKEESLEEQIKKCFFCPGNEEQTPKPTILEYRTAVGWNLRIVPNKFPAVSPEAAGSNKILRQQKNGVLRCLPGVGAHEVIIDTPRHGEMFADFTPERTNDLFWAFRERILDLRKDKRFQYILIFRNDGEAAGTSLSHSHCQLIAQPIIPPLIDNELWEAEQYYNDGESCVYCDMVKQELEAKKRIIFENECSVALAPYASRSPYEVWVIPKEHMSRYEETTPSYIHCIAKSMNEVAKRLKVALNTPAYNFYLHNAPLGEITELTKLSFHHHFEFVPRITRMGGFEWGTGLYINVVSPEEAAKALREVEINNQSS